jgi:hypothetical protein
MTGFSIEAGLAAWRTIIVRVGDRGELSVADRDGETPRRALAVEHVVHDTAPLGVGDVVVACELSGGTEPAVIIGRLSRHPDGAAASGAAVPDTLLIEAKESLTLRVGDGSITIRGDGKILIKGKDLVSHAKNVNRIKGGAVAIN